MQISCRFSVIIILTVLMTMAFACSSSTTDQTDTDAGDQGSDIASDESTDAGDESTDATPDAADGAADTSTPDGSVTCTPGEGSVAVLLPSTADRWAADKRFLEQAFDEAGVEYTIMDANNSPKTQEDQTNQAISDGAKVLMLVSVNFYLGKDLIAAAREAGVSVIEYDRLNPDCPGGDIYISFDNVAVGRTMGETLEPVIDGLGLAQPQIVFLNGAPADYNSTLFAQGYHEIADPRIEAGDWALLAEQSVPNWDPAMAWEIFQQILTESDNQVDAIFAANDGIADAVIGVLQEAGLDPKPISGQDATIFGLQHVLSGWQTMTAYKPIKLEATRAAEAAVALLNCQDVSTLTDRTFNNGQSDIPYIAVPAVAVTKDNIADTVIADGFRTWEEICVGEYAQFCPD